MPFDIADCIASSRRYLATEYLHHKRLMRDLRGLAGEEYHRQHMQHTRRRFLALMKDARHEHSL